MILSNARRLCVQMLGKINESRHKQQVKSALFCCLVHSWTFYIPKPEEVTRISYGKLYYLLLKSSITHVKLNDCIFIIPFQVPALGHLPQVFQAMLSKNEAIPKAALLVVHVLSDNEVSSHYFHHPIKNMKYLTFISSNFCLCEKALCWTSVIPGKNINGHEMWSHREEGPGSH